MRSIVPVLFTFCVTSSIAFAQAPFPVETVARVNELELEAHSQVEVVTKMLTDEETFEKNRKEGLRQGFGLLAVIGQALVEHPEAKNSKIHAIGLRDAALQFKRDSTLDQANTALAAVKDALEGKAPAEAGSPEHAWNKLINMHGMMEELNGRNSKILRALRRLKGTPEEGAHASIQGILALTMYADTHEVKDESKLPQWHEWSTEYREAVIKMGDAIRAKDSKAARTWFDKAGETCDKCHEVFQK